MKNLLSYLTAAVLIGICIPSAQAREAVTLDFFYDNLESSGIWQEVGDYGYCWRPNNVDQNWRPYSNGRWLYTDAGWTWDSDEPYGWAVYHYGRWADTDQVGWVWVPGLEWGPGWVSWRHNARYTGWAPLPPEAMFRVGIGFSSWVDSYYDIGPGNYRFMENRDFGAHSMRASFIDPQQNMSIMRLTANVTNITYQDNIIHNGGMLFDQQSRLSAVPLQRYKLDRRQDFEGDPRNQPADHLQPRVSGNSLSVFALPFAGTKSIPRKLADKVGNAQINHGWKNAGTPADVATMRAEMNGKVRTPRELPAQPKFEQSLLRPTVTGANRTVEHNPIQTGQPSKPNVTRDNNAANGDRPPVKTAKGPVSLPNSKSRDKITTPASPSVEPTDNARQNGGNNINNTKRGRTSDAPPNNVERKAAIPNTASQRTQPSRTESVPRNTQPEKGQPNGKDRQKNENGPG